MAGSATLSTSGGSVTVTQTSGRAIINWQDFSLGAGEFARFIQPDAASATLNRVVSGLPSDLEGTLQANGKVYLINPNGVVIGAGARIDTGGFLASTLDVADAEFLAGGDLHFSGTSTAAIQNLGSINALGGDVFLIARQVENSGSVAAANGTVGIAAGSEVLLTTGGDERLFIQAVSMPGTMVNSGTIAAAREGALRGIPAVAASAHPSVDLETASSLCARIAFDLARVKQARTPLLNVNVPPGWNGQVRATRLGARIYEEIVDFRVDPRGREYLWLGGPGVRHERDTGTDTDAYDDGAVSLTPLLLDLTSVADAQLATELARRLDGATG